MFDGVVLLIGAVSAFAGLDNIKLTEDAAIEEVRGRSINDTMGPPPLVAFVAIVVVERLSAKH